MGRVSITAGIKGFPWSLPFNSSIARLVRPCGPCLLFTVLAEFCQMTRLGRLDYQVVQAGLISQNHFDATGTPVIWASSAATAERKLSGITLV
jgi:hypothetical protein